MSAKNIKIFILLIIISSLVILLFKNTTFFISYIFGASSCFLIIFNSFYMYKKNILQGINENKDEYKIDKNNNDTQQLLNKKQEELTKNLKSKLLSFRLFLSVRKILSYVFLCYGFIVLSDINMLDVIYFIIGISSLPFFILLSFLYTKIFNKNNKINTL